MSGDLGVDMANSVKEAVLALSKKRYDAIVSDYQMPVEDGIHFLKSLRSAGDRTPFILFTGRGREEVVIEALNNGADSSVRREGSRNPSMPSSATESACWCGDIRQKRPCSTARPSSAPCSSIIQMQ